MRIAELSTPPSDILWECESALGKVAMVNVTAVCSILCNTVVTEFQIFKLNVTSAGYVCCCVESLVVYSSVQAVKHGT